MKRIYALLGSACVVASAMALPTGDFSKAQIIPEAQEKLAQSVKTTFEKIENHRIPEDAMYTRSWVDPNGTTWTVMVERNMDYRWCDVLVSGSGDPYTFEELPFYIVMYYLSGTPQGSNNTSYRSVIPVAWPCEFIYRQYWENPNISEEEADWSPVDPMEMALNADSYCGYFIYPGPGYCGGSWDDNGPTSWTICNPAWVGADAASVTFWGNAGLTLKNESEFTFTGGDLEEMTYDINNNLMYSETDAPAKSHNFKNNYSGTCRMLGFSAYNYKMNFGEVHVFDIGEVSTEIIEERTGEWDDYDDEWGPLHKYFICALDKNLSLLIDPEKKEFDREELGFGWAEDKDPNATVEGSLNLIMGAMYSAPEVTEPNGTWNMQTAEEIETSTGWEVNIVPEAGGLIPWGYNSAKWPWSAKDGLEVVYGTYYQQTTPQTFIQLGKGFEFDCIDIYGNNFKGSLSDKDFYFHPNWKNVHEVEMRPMGQINVLFNFADTNLRVKANNGAINVASAEAANVAIYTISGACVANGNVKAGGELSFNVAKGMYIVKVGNKAQKVIL